MTHNDDRGELKGCIERIVKLYEYDTYTLLDCVLTDDPDDPEYSANTAYQRLSELVLFEKLASNSDVATVEEFLINNGYSDDDVNLLNKLRVAENERHVNI